MEEIFVRRPGVQTYRLLQGQAANLHNMITIKSKLTQRDFINVSFVMLFKKNAVKVLTVLILVFLLISLFTALFVPEVSFSQTIVPLVMLAGLPLMTYFSAKKNFSSNQTIGESVEYNFDTDYLSMRGESFNSQLTWEKIHKVTETKSWLLIWQNTQIAIPIPKRDILEDQINDLRQILDTHKVKNNL